MIFDKISIDYYGPIINTQFWEYCVMVMIFIVSLALNFIKNKKEKSNIILALFSIVVCLIAFTMLNYYEYGYNGYLINRVGLVLYGGIILILLVNSLKIKTTKKIIFTSIIIYISGYFISQVNILHLLAIYFLLISTIKNVWAKKIGIIIMLLMILLLPVGIIYSLGISL